MAERIIINNQLNITLPDGFHVMDEAEKSGLRAMGEDFVAISDPDKHMVVTFGWKEVGGLALMLLSVKDLAKNMEKTMAKELKGYGYALGSYKNKTIAEEKACGFDYSYESQGIDMSGESIVLKKKNAVYYFHLYSRRANRSENEAIWREITDSACRHIK